MENCSKSDVGRGVEIFCLYSLWISFVMVWHFAGVQILAATWDTWASLYVGDWEGGKGVGKGGGYNEYISYERVGSGGREEAPCRFIHQAALGENPSPSPSTPAPPAPPAPLSRWPPLSSRKIGGRTQPEKRSARLRLAPRPILPPFIQPTIPYLFLFRYKVTKLTPSPTCCVCFCLCSSYHIS